nr:MAG: RNA-dependent RNA polymerase [brine shrimp yue-like virus 1]
MGDALITSDIIATEIGVVTGDMIAMSRLPQSRRRYALELQKMFSLLGDQSWEKVLINKYSARAKGLFRDERAMSIKTGVPVRLRPPSILQGNKSVWELYKNISSDASFSFKRIKDLGHDVFEKTVNAVDSNLYRLGNGVSKIEKSRFKNNYLSVVDSVATHHAFSQHLRYLHTSAIGHTSRQLSKMRKSTEEHPEVSISLPRIGFDHYGIHVSVIGDLVLIRDGKYESIISHVHFHRLVRLFEEFASLIICGKDIALKIEPQELPRELLRICWPVIEADVDFLGEVLKGVRSVLVAKLDTYSLWGEDSFRMLLSSMTLERREWVRELLPDIAGLCHSCEDAINLVNFYRAVPHPDTNLSDVFESIKGFQQPNRNSPDVIQRFEGTLRKTLYESLTSQGYEVRLKHTGIRGIKLEEMSNDTAPSYSRILAHPFTSWAAVEFCQVRGLPDIETMSVPATAKASQQPFDVEERELSEAKEWASNSGCKQPKLIKEARTLNDAASELKGESNLGAEAAIRRFKACIQLHEEFEAKYPNQFPEDIPTEEFASFVTKTPRASYIVGTEPKFGEVHKKVTRMFYIAEQQLKAITQRVERLGKQVSRRAVGVSIVKSYAGRRRDLENFCRCMTGIDTDNISMFVSFDMSEFSKKFPMELVRIYGKVLGEMTGKRWLGRIDVIFRAAFVIHNSRGFFDCITGVKGGFEGFLNFGWSVIHAVIMRIALESTGVEGELLTFSDDGLLLFYVKNDERKQATQNKVRSIQKVYSDHGLEFKMTKTLISPVVWEYLGDVCYNNHLLNMWVKEIVAVGRTEQTRGVEPFNHQIKALEAQCDASITAGANPLSACILKRILASMRLRRLATNLPVKVEEALFIIPQNSGGFRLKSAPECCLLSTVPLDSEIIADLKLLFAEDKHLASAITKGLIEKSKISKSPLEAILRPTRFSTTDPDTSGSLVLNEAIEIAKGNASIGTKVVKNPIRSELGERLSSVLPGMVNLQSNLIANLIHATPEWSAYSESLALVKGRGAIRLIPRVELKRLQTMDTKRCKNAIKGWREYIEKHESEKIDFGRLIEVVTSRTMRNLSLAPLKPSPRYTLVTSEAKPNVLVEWDEFDAKSWASSSYIEPAVLFPSETTTLDWYMERGADGRLTGERRLMTSVARFLSHAPEATELIRVLLAACNIAMPELPHGLIRGGHRKGGASSVNPDMKLNMPRMFDSLSTFRYLDGLEEYVMDLEHADRRTLGEAARVITSIRWVTARRIQRALESGHYKAGYRVSESDLECSFVNFPPIFRDEFPTSWNPPPCSDTVSSEFRASFQELTSYRDHCETVGNITTGMIDMDSAESKVYAKIMTKSLEEWIHSRVRSQGCVISPDRISPFPVIHQTKICVEAVVQAAWRILDPRLRRALADKLNALILAESHTRGMRSQADITAVLAPSRTALIEDISWVGVTACVANCADACILAGVPGASSSLLGPLSSVPDALIPELKRIVRLNIILRGGSLTVVRAGRSTPGRFSASHRKVYRDAFTNTLSRVYAVFADTGWDAGRTQMELGFNEHPDIVLDILSVFRSLLRESEHRTLHHPVNLTTSRIELWKFYRAACIVRRRVGRTTTDEQVEQMIANWKPSLADRSELRRAIYPRELGPDHSAMLMTGIKEEAIRRCRVIIGRYSPRKRYVDSSGPLAHQGFYVEYPEISHMCTTFFNTFLAVTARSIVEYPTDVEKLMLDKFAPSTSAVARVFGASTTDQRIIGDALNPDDLPEGLYSGLIDLISALLKELCYNTRLVGVKAVRNASSVVKIACDRNLDSDGVTVRYVTDSNKHRANYVVLALKTWKVESAVTSYLNLARKPGSCVTIFKDSQSLGGRYYVVAVCEDFDVVLTSDSAYVTPDVSVIEGTMKLEDLVPVMRIADQARSVSSLVAARISYGGLSSHTMNPLGYTFSFGASTGRNAQSNSSSAMLQAAIFSSRTSTSSHNKVGCYASVLLWLAKEENPKLIAPLVKKIISLRGNEWNRAKDDIGLVFSWLLLSNINPALGISTESITTVQDEISKVVANAPISLVAAERRVRQLDEIEDVVGTKKISSLMGYASTHLYSDPVKVMAIDGGYSSGMTVDAESQALLDKIF